MYPAKPGLIIGFHGCDITLRNRVVNDKEVLRYSKNDYDWLGDGIYFWENNQQRALDFAKEVKTLRSGVSKIKVPSVIGAVLDLGYCLDLLDSSFLELVRTSYNTLAESCKRLELNMPINKGVGKSTDLLLRNLDCAVIKNLHAQVSNAKKRPFDSVRGAFIEGDPIYANAGFHEKNHIQICIRNPNCIKGFFIPRDETDEWVVP